jgi:SHS family lactate transporter-like MFS transporter
MGMIQALKGWTALERHAVTAAYLAWTLDAFDYFVLVFLLTDISKAFGVSRTEVAVATTLTLAFRPLGALLFGRLADRFGRRPVLMLVTALYSVSGFATAFAPSLVAFLVIRGLFGVAMGGVWGIGASLAFETIQPRARGFVSGLLQSGYPTGYLAASLAFGWLYGSGLIDWHGMFIVGLVPGLMLTAYMAFMVKESPVFQTVRTRQLAGLSVLKRNWKLALYAIALMTGFNFFSHGTQDAFPDFLREQHHFDPGTISHIAVIYNIGAVVGGLSFGAISQRLGRAKTMMIAALMAMPVVWLWAFSETATMLALGAFAMQFCVQGAWGVVPTHLNELSPPDARGTFPGTVYQLGNLIASVNLPLQLFITHAMGGDYRFALAAVVVFAACLITLCAWLGPEAHNVAMAREPASA